MWSGAAKPAQCSRRRRSRGLKSGKVGVWEKDAQSDGEFHHQIPLGGPAMWLGGQVKNVLCGVCADGLQLRFEHYQATKNRSTYVKKETQDEGGIFGSLGGNNLVTCSSDKKSENSAEETKRGEGGRRSGSVDLLAEINHL